VSGCRQVSGYRADCVPSLSPLLPEVFLFGLGFRFTNLCAVTNMCPVYEEIVSSLSTSYQPEVFVYGYQHVSGFRCLSGFREDCVLPFLSLSVCAYVCVCEWEEVRAVLSVCCTYLLLLLLLPLKQPWRQRQQLAPPLS